MTDAEKCKNAPYYSGPNFKLRGLHDRLWENQTIKPFEVLGDDVHNNARWIKENRFILSNVGNESMECPTKGNPGFSYYGGGPYIHPDVVTCLAKCDVDCYRFIGSCRFNMRMPTV